MFFRPRRKDYHQNLIDHMTAAQYPDVSSGVCHGVTGMGLQAILLRDTAAYDKRIKDLSYTPICISNDILIYPPQAAMSYHAFMDGVAMYQSPYLYKQFFEPSKQPRKQDVMSSAPLILPDALVKQGGIAAVGNFCGAYTQHELYLTLKSLRSNLSRKNLEFPIGFVLCSNNHAFTIGYDPESSKWTLIEANTGPSKSLSDYEASRKIVEIFSQNGIAIFDTKIFVTGENQHLAKQAISEWQRTPSYLSQHIITVKHVRAKNSDGASLLYVAAQNGRLNIVKKLLANGADINASTYSTPSALYIASYNGYFDVVNELLKSGANVKADYHTGVSPLVAAANNRHIEIVKLLRNHGADLFEIIHDKEVMKLLQKSREEERAAKQSNAMS